MIRDVERKARSLVRAALREAGEEESIFLGTVFDLAPSGKYLHFLGSNAELCKKCKGSGCHFCGGTGSREAFEDAVFFEALEEEAARHGFVLADAPDPCDIILVREDADGEWF